jgi:hypothetical protein
MICGDQRGTLPARNMVSCSDEDEDWRSAMRYIVLIATALVCASALSEYVTQQEMFIFRRVKEAPA